MASNLRKLILVGILFLEISYVSTWMLMRQRPDAIQTPVKQERLVLYTLPGCSHCEKVHEFIKTQAISGKVKYTELSASDPATAKELAQRGTTCNLPKDQLGGVPLLWDNDTQKCLVGDQPINDFFAQQAGQVTQP